MENIIESKKQIPTVHPRIVDSQTELEKKIEAFKEGVLKEIIGHAKSNRHKGSLISAFVTGQMNINGLSWLDIDKEFLSTKTENCLICKNTFENGIGSFCQGCWGFWRDIRKFSPTVTNQLENQEDVLAYLKSKVSDKRLSFRTRNFISSFLKTKEEN